VKSSGRPKSYVFTPATVILRGIPLVAEGALPTSVPEAAREWTGPGTLPIRGVSTFTTQAARAKRETDEVLSHYRNRWRQGDRTAISELLDLNPEFIVAAWVRDALEQLLEGGLPLRRKGRPHGRYAVNPLIVVGLVQNLISTGRAPNREQAFARLEELGVLTYESAKDSFYRALRERRFHPILIEFPEFAQEISAETAAQFPSGERLLTGAEVSRKWEDPRLGTVTFTVRGE
jgi:hypothetical protein